MTRRTRRAMLTLLSSSFVPGCAWILYPERRWQENPGPIHVFPLVIDCLLFIPGLVPGIIAIAVDFGTRSIYVPRHQARRVVPGEVLPVETDTVERAEVRLLDATGHERARTRRVVDPAAERQRIELALPSDEAFTLSVTLDDRQVASASIPATNA
jgi:hypothetical protein